MNDNNVELFDVNFIIDAMKFDLKDIESRINKLYEMPEAMKESMRHDFLGNFADHRKDTKEDLFKELEASGPYLLEQLLHRSVLRYAYKAVSSDPEIKKCEEK